MFTAITAGAVSFWGWLKNNPVAQWVGGVALFIIGWTVLKNHLKEAGAQAERQAIAKKQAEVKAAVIERKSEIIQEERQNADEALAARDGSPHYPSASELPDDLASIGIRNRGGGGAS